MQVEDQASKLRNLMRETRQARTLAIASGKGGVGKSNVALNLSILLSAAGHRVALVDAYLGLANLDVLVGVDSRTNLSHVIAGRKRLTDVVVDLPCGVQFVPGASGLARMADLGEFQRAQLASELQALEADNDFVIIDCGAGIGPDAIQFMTAAQSVLVVTTPEPTAVTDAYAVVKVLSNHKYDGRTSLLVNFAPDRHQARVTYERISSVARQFLNVRLFDGGYVVHDMKIRDAVRRREPVVLAHPKAAASRCLAAIATKICSGSALLDKKDGFFRRVVNWFA